MIKKCTTCGQKKELAEFYKHKIHGHIASCKECEKEKSKIYRATHLEEIKKRRDDWIMRNPEYNKEYYNKNSDKLKEYQLIYREQNPEKVREACKKQYEKNKEAYLGRGRKRRAIKKRAKHENYNYWVTEIKCRKTFTCYWCGKKHPTNKLHIDHIIPLSKGGNDTWDNVCASCNTCNMKKHDKMPNEFITEGQLVLNF